MQNKNVLFLVHRIFNNDNVKRGGADYIIDYLISKGYSITTIEHPLNGTHESYIKTDNISKTFRINGNGPIRWIQEIVFNVAKAHKSDFALIISVDPLNFLSAYFLNKIKNRKHKTKILFHSIDYSENRFGNSLLDFVYNSLYSFAVKNADVVTYVSKLMGEKIQQLRKNRKNILFHLPNSPEFTKIPKTDSSKKNKNSLTFSKSFISNEELLLLQNVTTILKKRFPRIVLNIVGKISESTTIINPNIKDNLIMHGLVPYEKNLEIISNSYIGLGWYENKFSFEKYNDSLKLREYAASGVPSICNNKTSTAIEMDKEGAGIIANTEKELAGAIATFITNEKKYYDMHINSIRWAKENDKSKLLEKLLRTLGL